MRDGLSVAMDIIRGTETAGGMDGFTVIDPAG